VAVMLLCGVFSLARQNGSFRRSGAPLAGGA
jgi:hypothetical protein